MNPSNFPQVIRSRSRSPSPVSRRRVCSDFEGNRECLFGDDSQPTGNFLSVPHGSDDPNRLRSFSQNDRRYHHHHKRHHRGRVAELEDMANVEAVVNAHHHDHPLSTDGDVHHPPQVELQANNVNTGTGDLWPTRSEGHDPATHTCYGSTRNPAGRGRNSYTPAMEDALRRRLKFFFMDPCSKFRARGHWPWKLSLQIIKIIIITVQLVIFGGQRSQVVEYFERHDIALKHLLLEGWDQSFETMPYPPATGVYAIYNQQDFYNAINFAWAGYYNLPNNSLATVSLIKDNDTVRPVTMCGRFNNYSEFPNKTYIVEAGTLNKCTTLTPQQNASGSHYSIQQFLADTNYSISFTKMLDLKLRFTFYTFHLNLIETHYGPLCYTVNTTLTFSNYERSGQILIDLKNEMVERTCSGKIMSPGAADEEKAVKTKNVVYDGVVILICVFSSILCGRSLVRAWQLKQKTDKFFRIRFGKGLEMSDHLEFINLWYILIVVNDVVTIIGTAYKIRLENREFNMTYNNYDVCSLFLGLGALMAWIGCLRYLGFFKKYNILILTLKTAFPNVLRFSVCALAMYFGFMFCGWVILGPYHIKFRHLSTTSECLYSLVNGDDMFVTFSATVTDNPMVWYFARIYLYIFISLFIYCVLSLFISVIMDTYETLKECYEHGFPKSRMQEFIEECNDPIHSGLYRRQHTEAETSECSVWDAFRCCCCKKNPDKDADERTGLLTRTI